jgi:subtilase family serine protease
MRVFRFRPFLGFILPLCSLTIFAQRPEPRLGKVIAETSRAVLRESRTPLVRDAQDLGSVSPDMPVPGITLVFRRSTAQEAALQTLLVAQQNPASPLYHHWLTPETFAAQFGVADADIAATENWLVSHGFHIDNVARSRDRITFSGTAAQVQSAFTAELHHYRTDGELHFAPSSDLTLPASLASVTAAVLHLSDFRPKPNIKVITEERPDYTSSSTQAHYLSPADIATMYDVTPVFKRNIGAGSQGLAIVGQSYVNTGTPSSLWTFMANLGGSPVTPVFVPGSGVEAVSPGDQGESEIDLEYSSVTGARVFFVHVGSNQNYSVFDALAFAITEDIAPVVSISYGACETLLSASEMDQYNALFEQASAQGQTLVASSGDSGSTACAPYSSAQGVTPAEQQGLAVNFPADSPYVTAVGGTQMAAGTFAQGDNSYWAGAPNAGFDVTSSLLSYVPEIAWNEGSASHGIIAGGGGSSTHFPRPVWQSNFPNMPSGSYRLLPDVALQSSIASPGFILCTSDPALLSQEGQTSSCVSGLLGSNNKYTIAGGTSFAAPIFAGLVALLNSAENATGQGNLNPILYRLAANQDIYAAAFHDITIGTIACVAGATNCPAADQSSYPATVGYDEATGLGSIDVNALIAAWPSSNTASLQATNLFLISSETSAAPGQTVPIQITVQTLFSSNATLATGSVSISVDGTLVDSSLTLTPTDPVYLNTSATYNFVAPTVTGSHLITVTYPGDATHAPATATYSVMVGNVLASGSMTLTAGNLTVANGSTASTQITVTPTGGYNGRVVWSLSASGTGNLTGCYSIASFLPVNGVTTAKLTIGIGSACNSARSAVRAGFVSLTKAQVHSRILPVTVVYASLLICGFFTGSRRKMRLWLLAILIFPIAGANMTGCGGGGSKSGTSTPTPTTTTYTLTLTGKDSVNAGITASTTFTLTVSQ